MAQQSIFDQMGTSVRARFEEFHRKNPMVYKTMVRMTRQAKARGAKRVGMQMIMEVMRWNRLIRTNGDPYKLNNSYAPYYARLIIERNPDLEGIFEMRATKNG